MQVKGKKVFVGLSGGVDSAVSAALLQKAGAEVTGVFIKGWYPPGMPCTWASERRDAMRVAARLQIPFLTLDASAEYEKEVIGYLLREYRAGRTPNPDILCNKEVKFGAFYRFARTQGAEAIATGHYRSGEKDQSYFLWAVPEEVLASALFPVGHLEKGDVRRLAKKFNLPVAEKRDSQGVCFLGSVSIEEFLRTTTGTEPGRAVDETGEEVGLHDGVILSTIGQRVSLRETRENGPWFVLAKDIEKNELVVGKERTPRARSAREITFSDANWFHAACGTSEVPHAVEAQYRYRGPRCAGRVSSTTFISDEPLPELPAPGQSIVFYTGGKLLGGGIITA